jgi:hypothetical protein
MGDTFIISGLKEKRSAVAGRIVDLRLEIDRLQADLYHIDAVLKLYGLEPDEIPTKGRMPKRSTYFARGEISRRCYEMMRERGLISADDVAVSAMVDKGLDAHANRKQRADFTRRILVSLHDLRKAGKVDQIGTKTKVKWRMAANQEE